MNKQMLNTKQVRQLMRLVGLEPIYTNKTANHTGDIRRVKSYIDEKTIQSKLRLMYVMGLSAEDVTVTKRARYGQGPGVTIRCTLSK
jgi:hypothetical protein